MTDIKIINDPPAPFMPTPPQGWPVVMRWPPSPEMVKATMEAQKPAHKPQMRLFGRPAFVLDGMALHLIVWLTGHRVQVDLTDLTAKAKERASV